MPWNPDDWERTYPRDYAVVYRLDGILLHRADCGYVRWAAAHDAPVLTMMGCESEPDALTPRGKCLLGGVCEIPTTNETKETGR
jgi:hypothetical protein